MFGPIASKGKEELSSKEHAELNTLRLMKCSLLIHQELDRCQLIYQQRFIILHGPNCNLGMLYLLSYKVIWPWQSHPLCLAYHTKHGGTYVLGLLLYAQRLEIQTCVLNV